MGKTEGPGKGREAKGVREKERESGYYGKEKRVWNGT